MSDFGDELFSRSNAMDRFDEQYHRLLVRAVMNVDMEVGIPQASEDLIATLQDRKVRESELVGCDKKCSVCMESLKAGDVLKSMPCKHEFHEHCLIRWLKESNSCPLCRIGLENQDMAFRRMARANLNLDDNSAILVSAPFRRSPNRSDRRDINGLRRTLVGVNIPIQVGSNSRSQDESSSRSEDEST